jgi:hypothetical protein
MTAVVVHNHQGDLVNGDGSSLWWARYSKVGSWTIGDVL